MEVLKSYSHRHKDGSWHTHPGYVVCVSGAAAPSGRTSDPVSMPDHYTKLPVECIDVTEHFGFCLGNAIKYIWRADHKGNPIQDLEKAAWYVQREIERRKREQ